MDHLVKVGERYTIVIPKDIRRRMRIKKGQLVKISVEGNKIVIEPLNGDSFEIFGRILGDFKYDREARREAENIIMREAEK